MLPSDKTWFTEVCREAGYAVSWTIEEHLASVTSAYQQIDVYRTTHWGNLMVIDGFVMLTERDHFLYHEMLTHPGLFSHPDPRRVLIIGGGDCGTLSEVLKHDGVERCTQVEIDEEVTRLSERFFPDLTARNDDARAELVFADGLAWIRDEDSGGLDVIIVDSTDPVGPAEGLFGPDFVADCHRALADGGILVQQSESPLIHQPLIRGIRENMDKAGFDAVTTLGFPQPCYPSGWWSATLARKDGELTPVDPGRFAESGVETRYFTPAVHAGALDLQLP